VHRIGRTARNGATGTAITLVSGEERSKLRDVERLIRRTLPVTGELKGAVSHGAEGKPVRRGQSPVAEAPRPGERPRQNTRKHFSGSKKAAIAAERGNRPAAATTRGNADGPAWWERKTGEAGAVVAPKAKPRWTSARKKAAKAERGNEHRRQPVRAAV
jgi:ATP-dependent RNA helicase RhlE